MTEETLTQVQAERCARCCGLERKEFTFSSGPTVVSWVGEYGKYGPHLDQLFEDDEEFLDPLFWEPRLLRALMGLASFNTWWDGTWIIASYDSYAVERKVVAETLCEALCSAIEAVEGAEHD